MRSKRVAGGIPNYRSFVQIQRGPQEFLPLRLRVRLPYISTLVLGDGTAAGAFAVLRLNGPFDPEVAVGGGSPLGYVQLAAKYDRAIVHSATFRSKVTVKDSSTSTNRACEVVAGLHRTTVAPDLGSTFLLFDTYQELRVLAAQRTGMNKFIWRRIVRNLSLVNNTAGTSKYGGTRLPPLRIRTKNMGMNQSFPYGRLTDEAEGDPYGQTFDTANFPSYESYLTLFAISLPQDGQTVSLSAMPYTYFDYQITYDIEFFLPFAINQ